MELVNITDLKLRIFIDTNVLIDAFTTPEPSVVNFINTSADHSSIDLVTSDYVLWEHHEFIRQQIWIKYLVNQDRSYKDALKYKVKAPDGLKVELKTALTASFQAREDLNIENYNLMDQGTSRGDFFDLLVLLTTETEISSQDLLVLLSAYCTQSQSILSKDKNFRLGTGKDVVDPLQVALEESPLPEQLKDVFFISDLTKNPSYYYKQWFVKKFSDVALGKCINVYQQSNVISLEATDGLVSVGDYLMLNKFGDDDTLKRIIFQVKPDHLQDYDTEQIIEQGSKVTVKLPEDVLVEKWMASSQLYIISQD